MTHAHALETEEPTVVRSPSPTVEPAAQRAYPVPMPISALSAPAVIRRDYEELTSKDTVGVVGKIPVIAAALQKTTRQGPSVEQHVERALALFDQNLALEGRKNAFLNEAIRIATLIDATAAELAHSVMDPTLKPTIAKELIAAYRTELTAKLNDARSLDKDSHRNLRALRVAEAIVSADPVMRFMTDKLKVDDAAREIRAMAEQAKLEPAKMFDTLRSRFEMEIGAHSEAEVQKGERKKDTITETDEKGVKKSGMAGFDLADLIGEISPGFYADVVDLKDPQDAAKRKSTPTWTDDGLKMTAAATQKLDALKTAVTAATLKAAAATPQEIAAMKGKRSGSLNDKQAEHFVRLEQEEKQQATDYEGSKESPDAFIVKDFVRRYGVDTTGAQLLAKGVVTALESVPLTLTSNLDRLFKKRDDDLAEPFYGAEYKSEPALMKEEINVSKLVGKPDRDTKATGIGRPDDTFTESRGTNYMRWRRDKDDRETGQHGLGADDLPVFGAVNPNFNTTKGGNANKAEWSHDSKSYTGTTFGANYYGDMHMLLKDAVRPRSTLIARGKKAQQGRRIERTDLMLLLADMCRLKMYDYIDAMVADMAQTGKKKQTVLHNMDAEVHIYGGLNLGVDVQSIYVSHEAMKDTKKQGTAASRLKAFADAHGIELVDIGKKPSSYDLSLKRIHGVSGGIDMKALLDAM